MIEAQNVLFDEGKFYKDLYNYDWYIARGVSNAENDNDCNESGENSAEESSQNIVLQRSSREQRPNTLLKDFELSFCEAFFVNEMNPKWEEPKKEEMKTMRDHKVWDLVPRRPCMKVLRSRWVLKEKFDKLKAHLVAVGCDEVDVPEELFSPVVNMTTVKILLSYAVQKGFDLHQLDVSSAFLHGDLDYDVYMEQPKGFCKDETLVCKLKKAIYGLKVSPCIWNKCLNEFIMSLGFS